MPVKTTQSYHYTSISMAKSKKIINKKTLNYWRGYKAIEILIYCQWECKMALLPWKTFYWFLKMFDIFLPYDPTVPFLSITQGKLKFMFT